MLLKVSVIIPSYNSQATIEYTLRGLHHPENFKRIDEIIVVDSSDEEDSARSLQGHASEKLKVINAGQRVMPAIGRNIGAREASGDILVFIDADAYPDEDFVAQVIKAYEGGFLVGGGSIALPDFQERRVVACAQFFLQFNEYMDVGKARGKPFVPSCNLFCDREIFRKAGGFPEIRAAEDVLFGLTVSKFAKVWFIPQIKVSHIFRENMRGFLNNQILLGKYVMIYRRREFKDKVYYKKIWPLLLLPLFVVIKLFRITTRVMKSRPSLIWRYVISFPLFMVGLAFWSFGFAQGVFEHDNA